MNGRGWTWAGWLLLALTAAARLAHIDSDAYFNDWLGPVSDEGRWVETARNLTLFGDPNLYGLSRLHLLLSPGFQVVVLAIFKLAGVSIATARAFTVASSLALLLCWVPLRRFLSPAAWLLGAVVLGMDTTLFNLSRVALPEVPALLLSLSAFLVLLFGDGRARYAACAGVLLLLAAAMKATTLFVLPAFVAVAVAAAWQRPPRQRVGAALALLAPWFGCAALAAASLLVLVGLDLHLLRTMGSQLAGFVHLVDAYAMADRTLDASPGTVLLLVLGAWCGSWIWPARDQWRRTPAGRLYALSGLWAAGWLLVWGAMAYVPRRYAVHVSLPLLMHVLAALSVMGSLGPVALAQRFESAVRRHPLWGALWLTLPAAYLCAMSLVEVGHALGWFGDRLALRLLVIALTAALFAIAFSRRLQRPAWVLVAAFGPLAVATGWAAVECVAPLLALTPSSAFERSWAFGGLLAAALAIALWLAHAALRGRSLQRYAVAGLAVTGVALLAQQWPFWLRPTYLARDCSRRIAELVPPSQRIRSAKAAGVLIETRLQYVDQWTSSGVADIVVQYFPGVASFRPPGDDYVVLMHCPLTTHPRYPVTNNLPIEVVVYGRRDAPALADRLRPSDSPAGSVPR